MNFTLFSTITNKNKSDVIERLITHSTPSQDFYLMMMLAIAMAAFGLLLNNAAIIIGSMLISPMLYAFLSLSLGFSISDQKLISRSLISIIKAVIIGIGISALIALFATNESVVNDMITHANPSLAYGTVAFIAGFAAAFTLTKPQLNETLPGVAIAVTLIPPIAVSGIGLATLHWEMLRNSLLLFGLNAMAIFAGSLIVFLLMNIYSKKSLAQQTLKEEEKNLKEETKQEKPQS